MQLMTEGCIDLCTVLSNGSAVISVFATLGVPLCLMWWRNTASRVRTPQSSLVPSLFSHVLASCWETKDGKQDLVGWSKLPTTPTVGRLFAFYYYCASLLHIWRHHLPDTVSGTEHAKTPARSAVCGLAFQIPCSKLLLEPNQLCVERAR